MDPEDPKGNMSCVRALHLGKQRVRTTGLIFHKCPKYRKLITLTSSEMTGMWSGVTLCDPCDVLFHLQCPDTWTTTTCDQVGLTKEAQVNCIWMIGLLLSAGGIFKAALCFYSSRFWVPLPSLDSQLINTASATPSTHPPVACLTLPVSNCNSSLIPKQSHLFWVWSFFYRSIFPGSEVGFRGVPRWLSGLSVRLRLRSRAHGWWVQVPNLALCGQLGAWSLLQICDSLSWPFSSLCALSVTLSLSLKSK